MHFLYPSALLGLLLIAIPVAVHLFNFRKTKKVLFSNIRFLRQLKEETKASSKLKHLLVLMARCLAVLALVLAFAQPFFGDDNQTANQKYRTVSIFIDNSYSMQAQSTEGTLLDKAKNIAKNIANQYKISDKFQILTHDFEGKHQRLLSKAEFLNALESIKISTSNKKLSAILNRQSEALSRNTENKSRYVVSDFQTSMGDFDAIAKADRTLKTHLVQINSTQQNNVFIDTVYFSTPVQEMGQTAQLIVKVANESTRAIENQRIDFVVNGIQKGLSNLNIAAKSFKTDTISFKIDKTGWSKASLSLTDFPITFDDKYLMAFEVLPQVSVLVINDKASPNGYLDAFFVKENYLKPTFQDIDQLNYAALPTYKTIVLNNVSSISSGLSQTLTTQIKNGTSVVFFPASTLDLAGANAFLSSFSCQYKPLTTANMVVSSLNREDIVYEGVFRTIEKHVDLPKVDAYLPIGCGSSARFVPLLTLANGDHLLTKNSLGNGKLYLSAVGIDDKMSNFHKNALFAPILYRIGALSVPNRPLSYRLGESSLIEVPSQLGNKNETVYRLKSQQLEFIPQTLGNTFPQLLGIDNTIQAADFYDLLQKNGSDTVQAVVALNHNRQESRMTFYDAQDLKQQATSKEMEVFLIDNPSAISGFMSQETQDHWWRYLLAVALVCLALETVLIRFWK